jgi:hypothetical protein
MSMILFFLALPVVIPLGFVFLPMVIYFNLKREIFRMGKIELYFAILFQICWFITLGIIGFIYGGLL